MTEALRINFRTAGLSPPQIIFFQDDEKAQQFLPIEAKQTAVLKRASVLNVILQLLQKLQKLPNIFFLMRRDLGQNYQILFLDYHLALQICMIFSSTSAFTIEESFDAFQTRVSLELIASLVLYSF